MALTKTVRIPVANKAEGTRLRFRLYELRSCLKEEKHPDYASASRVSLSIIREDDDKWYVIGETADSSLDDVLDRAGVPNPMDSAPPLEDMTELYTLTEDDRKPIKPISQE
jgi:hypothetical protein